MKAIIGKKVGMTSIFQEGKFYGVTVLDVSDNVVTQVKKEDTDGYNAVQVGFDSKAEKASNNAEKGHFKKANTAVKRKVVEIRDYEFEKNVGETISVDTFAEGEVVSVIGTSKGKGFQGVVKRHGFGGVGQATHGQHNRLRAPGSVGASSYPSRVFKGMRMAGRMGGDNVKVQNLRVLKVVSEKNLLVVKGCIPGCKNSYVIIQK